LNDDCLHPVECCAILWNAVQYCGMLCNTVECCRTLWNAVHGGVVNIVDIFGGHVPVGQPHRDGILWENLPQPTPNYKSHISPFTMHFSYCTAQSKIQNPKPKIRIPRASPRTLAHNAEKGDTQKGLVGKGGWGGQRLVVGGCGLRFVVCGLWVVVCGV
jgi:hypothetical protein